MSEMKKEIKDLLLKDKEVLNELYDSINEAFFQNELPGIVINLQPFEEGRNGSLVLGHYWKDRWNSEKLNKIESEININPVAFGKGPLGVVITMHHEMVHYSNSLKDIKDVRKNNKTHNKHFENACNVHDLYVEVVDDSRGFVTPETYELQSEKWKKWYDEIVEKLNLNDRFLHKYIFNKKFKKEAKRLTFICEDTGNKFKISAKALKDFEDGVIETIKSPYTGGVSEQV